MTESGIVCQEVSVEQLKQMAVAEGIGALCGYSAKGRESQREALIRVAEIGGRAFERRLVEGSGRGMEEMLTMILQRS